MHASPAHTSSSDEIDLQQLACTLWASKLLIICSAVVFTGLAAIYVLLTPPIYQVEVTTLPPPASGVADYNMAHQVTGSAIDALASNYQEQAHRVDNAIPALTPDDVYDSFLRISSSTNLRQQFFDQVYLPYATVEGLQIDVETKARLWRRFTKQLKITLPKKAGAAPLMVLALAGKDPDIIAGWANRYIEMAISATKTQLEGNLRSDIQVRLASVDQQVKAMQASGETERQNTIAKLEEALTLANAVGLQTPPSSGNLITSYSGETMYLRGTKALHAQLEITRARANNDPYTVGLPSLLKKQALLRSINAAPETLIVAQIDQFATPPEEPIKPKKTLILALGFVLGGMLGIFYALIRQMFGVRMRSRPC